MPTQTTRRKSSATTRKSAARKATASKPASTPKAKTNGHGTIDPRDKAVQAKVAELRANKTPWDQVAEKVGVGLGNKGKLELAYFYSQVKPKDRIKGSDDEIAKAIVHARDVEKQPWGFIAARCDLPEGRVRRLYESASGGSAKGVNVAQARKAAREGSTTTKPATSNAKSSSGTRGTRRGTAKTTGSKSAGRRRPQ